MENEILRFQEALEEHIRVTISAENDRIEKAFELSLQRGTCGIKVVRNAWRRLITVDLDESVPYGTIREHISQTNLI
jgi:hypothetical protein